MQFLAKIFIGIVLTSVIATAGFFICSLVFDLISPQVYGAFSSAGTAAFISGIVGGVLGAGSGLFVTMLHRRPWQAMIFSASSFVTLLFLIYLKFEPAQLLNGEFQNLISIRDALLMGGWLVSLVTASGITSKVLNKIDEEAEIKEATDLQNQHAPKR